MTNRVYCRGRESFAYPRDVRESYGRELRHMKVRKCSRCGGYHASYNLSPEALAELNRPITGAEAEAAGKREYLRVTGQLGEDWKMIDARFVPITEWPGGKAKGHLNAAFRSNYIKTLDLLEHELKKLGAREIVVQCFYSLDQIRNDGWPKANQKPSYPGVIVSFKTRNGALSFPCDRYWHIEHNMHAIALSLEALRAVDRYGVTKRAEQYAGWKQIEAPAGFGFTSKEDAATFIATQGSDSGDTNGCARDILRDATVRDLYYREAVKRMHPDRGGDYELFVRLQQAKAMLEAA